MHFTLHAITGKTVTSDNRLKILKGETKDKIENQKIITVLPKQRR